MDKYPELTFIAITEGNRILYQSGHVSGLDTVDTQAFEKTSTQYLNASLVDRIHVVFQELPMLFSLPMSGETPKSDVFRLDLTVRSRERQRICRAKCYICAITTDRYFL